MRKIIAFGVDLNSFIFGVKYSPCDEFYEEDEEELLSALFICFGPFYISVAWDGR